MHRIQFWPSSLKSEQVQGRRRLIAWTLKRVCLKNTKIKKEIIILYIYTAGFKIRKGKTFFR